jgi:acyl-CoA hydrolase
MVHSWQSPHLCEIVVTENGIADVRDKSDRDVAVAMQGIADSRFQDELLGQGKGNRNDRAVVRVAEDCSQ